MKAPLVSVVMTSYNDPPSRLRQAVDSILRQSMSDLELLVAFEPGDANADAIAKDVQDVRLTVLRNTVKEGISRSLNHCLENARGRYIARMDSDDWAYPDRLEKQLFLLGGCPDLSLVGGGATIIDDDGNVIATRRFGTSHEALLRRFSLMNALCHPTVIWDRDKVGYDLAYDENCGAAEDLELWFRLLRRGHHFATLDEPVIAYKQTSEMRRPMKNWRSNLRVRAKHWRLAFRHPILLAGLCVFSVLSVAPKSVVDRLTRRGLLSDYFRSIRPTAS